MICVEGNEILCLIRRQFIKNYIGCVNAKEGRSASKFRVHNEQLPLSFYVINVVSRESYLVSGSVLYRIIVICFT